MVLIVSFPVETAAKGSNATTLAEYVQMDATQECLAQIVIEVTAHNKYKDI